MYWFQDGWYISIKFLIAPYEIAFFQGINLTHGSQLTMNKTVLGNQIISWLSGLYTTDETMIFIIQFSWGMREYTFFSWYAFFFSQLNNSRIVSGIKNTGEASAHFRILPVLKQSIADGFLCIDKPIQLWMIAILQWWHSNQWCVDGVVTWIASTHYWTLQ